MPASRPTPSSAELQGGAEPAVAHGLQPERHGSRSFPDRDMHGHLGHLRIGVLDPD
jgi:hypothetical protein